MADAPDPVELLEDNVEFLQDNSATLFGLCTTQDETGFVARAILRADAQATAARNADFTQGGAALAQAMTEVQTAKAELSASLKHVQDIKKVLDQITGVLDAASKVLQAGILP